MYCLYVPNSVWLKTRARTAGTKNVTEKARARPVISINAGLNVESDCCIGSFRCVPGRGVFCCSDECDEDVRPPGIGEASRKAASDTAPQGNFKSPGIWRQRSLLQFPGVPEGHSKQHHEDHKA